MDDSCNSPQEKSTESSSTALLTVYPSPVTSLLTVEIESNMDYDATIQVLGNNGQRRLQQVESLVNGRNQFTIDVSDLNDGIFMLSIPDEKGKLQTTRFMKIKGQ